MSKTFEELFEEHYEAIIKRNAILSVYTHNDFLDKVKEEVFELSEMFPECMENEEYYAKMKQEAVDVLMTVVNMFRHFNIDIKEEIEMNINHNKERKN